MRARTDSVSCPQPRSDLFSIILPPFSVLDHHADLITRLTGDLAEACASWEDLAFLALGNMLGPAPRFPKRWLPLRHSMRLELADDDAQDAFHAGFADWARQHQPDDDDDLDGPATSVRVWLLPPKVRMARLANAIAAAEFVLPPRASEPRRRAGPSQPKASTCHLCHRGIRQSGVLLGPSCRARLHEAVETCVKSADTRARLLQLLADDQLDELDAILKVSARAAILVVPTQMRRVSVFRTINEMWTEMQHFINFWLPSHGIDRYRDCYQSRKWLCCYATFH